MQRPPRANGFALFTADAVAALGLDPSALGMVASEEEIEHLGRVSTFTLDLESRWQAETGVRRLADEGATVIDLDMTVSAEPAVVWAHLTSPALRSRWEGPIVVEEQSPGGRRGVGTTAQCVTGRLATLEEIVDWQPYDHVGWRLAVPGLGPVIAGADLEAVPDGTRLRLRWLSQADPRPSAEELSRVRLEREAAYRRLARAVAGTLPVIDRDRQAPAGLTSEGLQGLLPG